MKPADPLDTPNFKARQLGHSQSLVDHLTNMADPLDLDAIISTAKTCLDRMENAKDDEQASFWGMAFTKYGRALVAALEEAQLQIKSWEGLRDQYREIAQTLQAENARLRERPTMVWQSPSAELFQ